MIFLYDLDRVCCHGTCTRPHDHEGRCDQFDGPTSHDALCIEAQRLGCAGCGVKKDLCVVVSETVRALCSGCRLKIVDEVAANIQRILAPVN